MRSLTLVVAGVMLLVALAPATVRASHDVGPDRVYFPETGHYLAYAFLDYWRHNGGLEILGYPVSEEFSDQGQRVQYFERAVLSWDPDAPDGWRVQLRRLGSELTAGREDEPAFQRVDAVSNDSTMYFSETGHRLSFGFRDFWEANGGLPIFGYPISEEFSENGYTVQYFERARFEWHPEHQGTPFEILLGHLGTAAADANDVDRAPVPQSDDVERYDPGLWYVPAPPTPADVIRPPAGAPAGNAKWIEIDLTQQYLRAWSYNDLVAGTYISSGIWRYPTVTGTFQVYMKFDAQRMTGGRGADYYDLPNVPDVMYFYADYAIHGAYWHNNFGVPMSHGCVNLPLGIADWLYGWTPMGTTVWVHY